MDVTFAGNIQCCRPKTLYTPPKSLFGSYAPGCDRALQPDSSLPEPDQSTKTIPKTTTTNSRNCDIAYDQLVNF